MCFFRYACLIQPPFLRKMTILQLNNLILVAIFALTAFSFGLFFALKHFNGYSKTELLCKGMVFFKMDSFAGEMLFMLVHFFVFLLTTAKISMYIRIYIHLYRHNQKNLGLPAKLVHQRRKKNVITLFGEVLGSSAAFILNIVSVLFMLSFEIRINVSFP